MNRRHFFARTAPVLGVSALSPSLPAQAATLFTTARRAASCSITADSQAAAVAADAADVDAALRAALGRLHVKQAAAEVAEALGLPRRDVYQRALALKDGDGDGR